MHVLAQAWRDGYLDHHLGEGEVRIAVKAWRVLGEVRDVFVPQPRSLARVWNYLREVGLVAVLRKIGSRLRERERDQKFVAVGCGVVLEAAAGSPVAPGDAVAFVAPCHPPCLERVVLPAACLARVPAEQIAPVARAGGICLFDAAEPGHGPDLSAVAGWSRFSGRSIDAAAASLLERQWPALQRCAAGRARVLPLARPSPVRERVEGSNPAPGVRRAVLFGLGHYARTNVLPNLPRGLRVTCIHEIDPTQIGPLDRSDTAYDTAESPRPDEHYDVYLIAGYHHTHADLATHAIRQGAYAVVEKPLATTFAQLARLTAALEESPGRLFACFHKRYSPLNATARRDLGVRPGDPIHMQCIAYEIPLPGGHWYTWPNSRSRLTSNGCHWIDHFLWMNDFAAPRDARLCPRSNGDLHVSLELENGAAFGLCLTSVGSDRLGVREHVEMRVGGTTVAVDDFGRYRAENHRRVLRRARINRMSLYGGMYREIGRRILAGEPGDSTLSVQRSAGLILQLEDMLADKGAQ